VEGAPLYTSSGEGEKQGQELERERAQRRRWSPISVETGTGLLKKGCRPELNWHLHGLDRRKEWKLYPGLRKRRK